MFQQICTTFVFLTFQQKFLLPHLRKFSVSANSDLFEINFNMGQSKFSSLKNSHFFLHYTKKLVSKRKNLFSILKLDSHVTCFSRKKWVYRSWVLLILYNLGIYIYTSMWSRFEYFIFFGQYCPISLNIYIGKICYQLYMYSLNYLCYVSLFLAIAVQLIVTRQVYCATFNCFSLIYYFASAAAGFARWR